MNPYEAPRAESVRTPRKLEGLVAIGVYAALALKALQLAAWVYAFANGRRTFGMPIDAVLHLFGCGALLARQRIAIVPLLVAAAFGVTLSFRGDVLLIVRLVYYVGLPLVLVVVALRHWRAFAR